MKDEYGIKIGQNIQFLRKARKISQYQIVKEMEKYGRKMSRAQYAHIEQGIGNIYVKDLSIIREILAVDYSEFFIGVEIVKTQDE